MFKIRNPMRNGWIESPRRGLDESITEGLPYIPFRLSSLTNVVKTL